MQVESKMKKKKVRFLEEIRFQKDLNLFNVLLRVIDSDLIFIVVPF